MNAQFMPRWVLLFNLIVILVACSVTAPSNNTPSSLPESVRNTPQIFTTPVSYTALPPKDVWMALLQQKPYPYTTPLPERTPTILDSIYVKVEPKEGTPVPCRRCPDYLIEGGVWKLSLDKGAYHIFHEATRWRSLGSYSISGDRFYIFNDPACLDEIGIYRWQQVEGGMELELIEDKCQVGRRGQNFAQVVWQSCQPPSIEAAVTNHWSAPSGCEN